MLRRKEAEERAARAYNQEKKVKMFETKKDVQN